MKRLVTYNIALLLLLLSLNFNCNSQIYWGGGYFYYHHYTNYSCNLGSEIDFEDVNIKMSLIDIGENEGKCLPMEDFCNPYKVGVKKCRSYYIDVIVTNNSDYRVDVRMLDFKIGPSLKRLGNYMGELFPNISSIVKPGKTARFNGMIFTSTSMGNECWCQEGIIPKVALFNISVVNLKEVDFYNFRQSAMNYHRWARDKDIDIFDYRLFAKFYYLKALLLYEDPYCRSMIAEIDDFLAKNSIESSIKSQIIENYFNKTKVCNSIINSGNLSRGIQLLEELKLLAYNVQSQDIPGIQDRIQILNETLKNQNDTFKVNNREADKLFIQYQNKFEIYKQTLDNDKKPFSEYFELKNIAGKLSEISSEIRGMFHKLSTAQKNRFYALSKELIRIAKLKAADIPPPSMDPINDDDLIVFNRYDPRIMRDSIPIKTRIIANKTTILDNGKYGANNYSFCYEIISKYKYCIDNIWVKLIRNPSSLQGENKEYNKPLRVTEQIDSTQVKIDIPQQCITLTLCDNQFEITVNLKDGRQKKFNYNLFFKRVVKSQYGTYFSSNIVPLSSPFITYTPSWSLWDIDSSGNDYRKFYFKNHSKETMYIQIDFGTMYNYDEFSQGPISSISRVEYSDYGEYVPKNGCWIYAISGNETLSFRQYLKKCQQHSKDGDLHFEALAKKPPSCKCCDILQKNKNVSFGNISSNNSDSTNQNKSENSSSWFNTEDLIVINRLDILSEGNAPPSKTRIKNNSIINIDGDNSFLGIEFFTFEVLSKFKDKIKNIEVKLIRDPESIQGQVFKTGMAFDNTVSEYSILTMIGAPQTFNMTLCENIVEVTVNAKDGRQKKYSFTVNYARKISKKASLKTEKTYHTVHGNTDCKYSISIAPWKITENGVFQKDYIFKNESNINIRMVANFDPLMNYEFENSSQGPITRYNCPQGQTCNPKCVCRVFEIINPGQEVIIHQYLTRCQPATNGGITFNTFTEDHKEEDCKACDESNNSSTESSEPNNSGNSSYLSSSEIDQLLVQWEESLSKLVQKTDQMIQGNVSTPADMEALSTEVATITEKINRNLGNFSEKQLEKMNAIGDKFAGELKNIIK